MANSFAKDTAVMSLGTTISRVTGLIRVMALAYALGATHLADSYNLANVMPNMIYELFMGGILSSLFIPIFLEYLTQKTEREAWQVANLITNVALVILAVITLASVLFSYYLVRIQTVRVSPEEIQLANFFFKIFAFQIIFYGLSSIFTGILNSYKNFTIPAFAPIINNVIVIITTLFVFVPLYGNNPKLALLLLALGTTLGVFFMALVQLPPLFRVGFRYHPFFNFRHPALIKLGKLALPLFLYVASNQITLTVENNLAFPFEGGVTAIQWSKMLFQLPHGIFAVSIITALFPSLSEQAASHNNEEFKKSLSLGLRTIGLIILPASASLIALSEPVIRLVLEHGRFTSQHTQFTAPVLAFYALGLFSFASFVFLLRSFYSLQDTITPLIANTFGMVFNIAADIVLVKYFGVKGIALGYSLTYTLTAGLLIFLLRRRVGKLKGKYIIKSLFKFLIASVPTGIVAYTLSDVIQGYLDTSRFAFQITQFLVAAAPALLLYLLLIYIFKSEEINLFKDLIGKALFPGIKR